MIVTQDVAKDMLIECMAADLVPFLQGPPGIGKSGLVQTIADEYNLYLIDERLSQADPIALNGVLMPNGERTRAEYLPLDTFPLEGLDEIPEGYNGWLVFLDEINAAPLLVQAASYKVLLDKMIGQRKMHAQVAMMCAGNLMSDGAIVNRIGTAMQSRLIHLEMAVEHEPWLAWARKNNLDYRVTSYIQYVPTNLHRFDPKHEDKTFPCPRTWEFVSRLVKSHKQIPSNRLPLLAGAVGEGAAREFHGYCQIFENLVTYDDVVAKPDRVNIPRENAARFALTGTIGAHAKPTDAKQIMTFVDRLPMEFQVITLREIIRRNPKMVKCDAVDKWVKENSKIFHDA